MKKLGLVLVFLICFGTVDVFCGGKKDDGAQQQAISGQQKAIEDLQEKFSNQEIAIGAISEQQKTIGQQLSKLDNQEKAIADQGIVIGEQLSKLDNQEKAISAIGEHLKEIKDQLTATAIQQAAAANPVAASPSLAEASDPILPTPVVSAVSGDAASNPFNVEPVPTGLVQPNPAQSGQIQPNSVQLIQAQTPPTQPYQPQVTQASDSSQERPVPITKEIIAAVAANNQSLHNLWYYLSIPLVLISNNQERTGIINDSGVFIQNEVNSSMEFTIPTSERGRLEDCSDGKEKFVISFFWTDPGKAIRLTFERNEQKNCYDLASANDDRRIYTITKKGNEPIPQLFIRYVYNIRNQGETMKVQGFQAAQSTESEGSVPDPQRGITAYRITPPQLQQIDPQATVPAPPPSLPREMINVKNISIEGRGSLTRNDIVRYIKSYNPNPPQYVETLVEAYINIARMEGINHDIAIAQMCYATNYLKDRQLINTYNYAGFDPINRVPVTYRNMEEGVRAHIQHLKGYATQVRPQGNIVDKRYFILGDILGTVKTLDALFRVWAPNNYQNYGNNINGILERLYGISG